MSGRAFIFNTISCKLHEPLKSVYRWQYLQSVRETSGYDPGAHFTQYALGIWNQGKIPDIDWVTVMSLTFNTTTGTYYANVAHLFYPSSTSLSRGLLLNKCTLKYAVRAQHTTFTASHHQVFFRRWTMEAMPRDEGNMKPMHFDDRHNIWHGIR